MTFYYIDTIEQVLPAEGAEYNVNEYGKKEQWKLPFEQVQAKYFKKLSDVSADLIGGGKEDAKHYYMGIKLIDGEGHILIENKLGEYTEPVPVDKPEPTPEPEEEVEPEEEETPEEE